MIDNPGDTVIFHRKPVVGFSARLTVIKSPRFTDIVVPFCSPVTTIFLTGAGEEDPVAFAGPFPRHPVATAAIKMTVHNPATYTMWFMVFPSKFLDVLGTGEYIWVYLSEKKTEVIQREIHI